MIHFDFLADSFENSGSNDIKSLKLTLNLALIFNYLSGLFTPGDLFLIDLFVLKLFKTARLSFISFILWLSCFTKLDFSNFGWLNF